MTLLVKLHKRQHCRFLGCLLYSKETSLSGYLVLEAETLTKLACLTTIEAFWCEKETSNKVVNLRNLHNLQSARSAF